MPFRQFVGYWTCVIIGRWIGGLLGYKPFFKEYTTDWDFAVAKMKGSWSQRHLVEESYTKEQSWGAQIKAGNRGKPLNAEFEQWTVDLSEDFIHGTGGKVVNGDTNGSTFGEVDICTVSGKDNQPSLLHKRA